MRERERERRQDVGDDDSDEQQLYRSPFSTV